MDATTICSPISSSRFPPHTLNSQSIKLGLFIVPYQTTDAAKLFKDYAVTNYLVPVMVVVSLANK